MWSDRSPAKPFTHANDETALGSQFQLKAREFALERLPLDAHLFVMETALAYQPPLHDFVYLDSLRVVELHPLLAALLRFIDECSQGSLRVCKLRPILARLLNLSESFAALQFSPRVCFSDRCFTDSLQKFLSCHRSLLSTVFPIARLLVPVLCPKPSKDAFDVRVLLTTHGGRSDLRLSPVCRSARLHPALAH